MPTGPRATSKGRHSESLARRVPQMGTLLRAWHAIKENGETSRSRKTRDEIKAYGSELPSKLRRIQERLRRQPYEFAQPFGATPEKAKGKGKRPLVVAPIEDRIVQRAILDVLQEADDLTAIQDVLKTRTSVGGIKGRGVADAMDLIEEKYNEGNAQFVAGSDISGFFTKISQSDVVDFIKCQTDDQEFVELFARALKVELANAAQLTPEELAMFPNNGIGVAQGNPLSAFAGNVILRGFDSAMNDRGITCIRYIDDFILLGRKKEAVTKAFESASTILAKLGMSIYRPEDRPDKAFFGDIKCKFEFLGHQLIPALYPPALKNRQKFLNDLKQEFDMGKAHILRALNVVDDGKSLQLYAHTLVMVDKIARAWSGSFRSSKCLTTAEEIDEAINTMISQFIAFYQDNTARRSKLERRRALGVHVLANDVRRRQSKKQAPPKKVA